MQPLLEIFKASKSFTSPEGGTVTALNDVSLKVATSEFVTLLGPSGCGKTTMLRTISGFETLDAGDIAVDGTVVTDLPAHKRPVNTVFQKYALFPHLNVARNVGYALEISGTSKAETRQRVGELLEMVGLAGLENRKISQLSGGQQQRVALARALVARPKLLLLDEPLSALDRNLRQKMQHELKTLQSELGIGFVFVTHDQEEALTMSDRIAVLAHGQIQQLGKPEELYRRPKNLFIADFLGESNLIPVQIKSQRAILPDGQSIPCDEAEGPATLLIRPETLSRRPSERPSIQISGQIRQVFYEGKDWQVKVETEAFGALQILLRTGSGTPQIGDAITLNAAEDNLHLIPETVA